MAEKKKRNRPATAKDKQLLLRLPGTVTAVSLELPTGMQYDEWRETVHRIHQIKEASNWWAGDVLNHGEAHFGEQYAQVTAEIEGNMERLKQLKFVASRIPILTRVKGLSWTHHRTVALADGLTIEDRAIWLVKALKQGWTTRELDEAIKQAKNETAGVKQRDSGLPGTVEMPNLNGNGLESARNEPRIDDICPICDSPGATSSICHECLKLAGRAKRMDLSAPQHAILKWALDFVREPETFDSEAAQQDWHAHYAMLVEAVKKGGNKVIKRRRETTAVRV